MGNTQRFRLRRGIIEWDEMSSGRCEVGLNKPPALLRYTQLWTLNGSRKRYIWLKAIPKMDDISYRLVTKYAHSIYTNEHGTRLSG